MISPNAYLATLYQAEAAHYSARARAYLSCYLAFGIPWDEAEALRYQGLAQAAYATARAIVAAL